MVPSAFWWSGGRRTEGSTARGGSEIAHAFPTLTSFATLVHFHPDDQQNMIVFMDNLAMAGGLLLFTQYGGGAFSLDSRGKHVR